MGEEDSGSRLFGGGLFDWFRDQRVLFIVLLIIIIIIHWPLLFFGHGTDSHKC